MAADATIDVKLGSLSGASMRYHELALQKWLYSRFFVREGYPIPVVFATPMDAFSQFTRLWSEDKNPFQYLLDVKDETGKPIYEPHPSPVRYPLISVYRKGFKLRPYQNFSTHNWRHVNWPTLSDDVTKSDLGNVTTSKMPMAFDYTFQIDHYCLRPDTQAMFIEKLLRQFWRGGASLQSWLNVSYPGWGERLVRFVVDGDSIDNASPEEPEDGKNTEFRTSFTLKIEGWSVDLDFQIVPALWKIVLGQSSPNPAELNALFEPYVPVATIDLRATGTNLVLDSRPDIPSSGTIAQDLEQIGVPTTYQVYFGDSNLQSSPADNSSVVPAFSYGIPSSGRFGTFTIS
jgi:hypothetical protein